MQLLSRDLFFRRLRAIAKKLTLKQSIPSSSAKKRPRSPSSSTVRPSVDHSTSSSSSSSATSSTYRNDIRRVFAEYDIDGDGRISSDELTRIVTAVGGGLSATDAAAEAAAMMEVADLDRDGYIGFQEFHTLMTTGPLNTPSPRTESQHDNATVQLDAAAAADDDNDESHPQHPGHLAWAGDEDIRLAFAVYDHDGDGVITAQEIHAVLCRVMETTTITLADCRKMVQAVDRDGDGVVGFHDFAAMMMR